MSDEPGAIPALKNAWAGAVAAADRLRELDSSVHALKDDAAMGDVDLDAFHGAALAQATAALALQGLVEELRRKRERA